MTTQLTSMHEGTAAALEAVVMKGDLTALSASERLAYYRAVCESVGLNPLTRPFDFITLNAKLTLYAKKDATDQLANRHKLSRRITDRQVLNEIYLVTAEARTTDGRIEESTGAVSLKGKSGDDLANAYMKAETKAKRRVTLSICGLGMLDETEIETIPDARIWTENERAPVSIAAPESRQIEQPKRDPAQDAFFAAATAKLSLKGLAQGEKRALVNSALGIVAEEGVLGALAAQVGWDYLRQHIEDGVKLPDELRRGISDEEPTDGLAALADEVDAGAKWQDLAAEPVGASPKASSVRDRGAH